MVMIANKKSSDYMKEELPLFIDKNVVDEFVDWLHNCLEQIKLGKDPFVAKKESKVKSTPINNEIQNVDTKKPKSIRKEITFNKNEFVDKNDDNKSKKQFNQKIQQQHQSNQQIQQQHQSNQELQQHQFNQQKIQSFQQQNLTKSDEQNKRSSYKRITYNLDDNQNDDSPPKKSKNPINYTQSTNRTTNIHSRLTLPQSSSSINSNDNRKNVSLNTQNHNSNYSKQNEVFTNNQIRSTKTSFNSTQNRSIEISSFNHKYQQANFNDFKRQETILDEKVSINQLSYNKKKPSSMIFKAIEEANKSSNLDSVTLRKPEQSKGNQQKKSLINRLGRCSTIDNDTKDIEPKKENRIVNSKLINQHLNKLSLNGNNRNEQKSNNQTIKTRLQQQKVNNQKDNQLVEAQQNLKSDDLRHRLSSKRKNDNEQINLIKRKVLNNQNQKDQNIEDDEELKRLKNNIKPKTALINDHLKSNNSNDDEQKKDTDTENINSIIKKELLEKVKYYEAKLKLSNMNNKDNKEPINQIKKERCMYWPLCNLKDKCQYHHPNTICLQFPSCKFGALCLNIHPKCKFDKLCTKQNCPYTHTFARVSKLATTATFVKYKIPPTTIQKITPN